MNKSAYIHDNLAQAEQHLLFHHNPSTTKGWITLAKKDPETHRFKQYHYQPEELAAHLSEWSGEDVFYSQNSFFKPSRRIDNIKQLKSLYVDLDVYNLGFTPEWVLGKLEFEYFGQVIPEPNMVIFSGRGLVLIWHIEPLPHMAMPLWKAVETFFAESLKSVGADSKATDPARIFRLPGTINSKNNATVTAEYRHDYRYDIHDLQYDYLPELTPPPPKAKKKPGRKPKILHLFNTYTLHLARALDITKLVELRNGDVKNHREYICFLYRYFTCCYTSDPQRALEETLELNSEFAYPLPLREVKSATESAERAWAAKSNDAANEAAKKAGFPGAGYNLSNDKLIQWLDITPEEQEQLQTIISASEKRRRKRVHYHANKETILKQKEADRRAAGVRHKDEYNRERYQAKMQNVQKLKSLIEDNPEWTNAVLAEKMGMTVRNIRRLKQLM